MLKRTFTLFSSIATALLFLAGAGTATADSAPAASPIPNTPILFTKRLNYQGLHIYDTFYQWRPGGGIYILENPADPQDKHRVRPVIDPTTPVTLGPGIYFDPSLSFDATKILFCHKASPSGNSTIYEIRLDGTGLRQITNLDKNGNPYKGNGSGHHDVKPSYLADGRIVFCSTRYSGLVPCANNGVAIMHVANADGSDIHTISVNNVTEFDPTQLPDGRILFGRWEYIDKNALTIQSIWTVNPSGTNETALYSNNMVFPEAVLQAKPVPGSDHLVVATFAPHNAPPRGSIAIINTKFGKNDPAAITNFEHPDRPTYDRGESCDPWALSATSILYSGLPTDPDSPRTTIKGRSNPRLNAIMHLDGNGKKTLVHSDPSIDLHNPIPILPRPLPRFVPDTTDRTKITGNFLVINVNENLPANIPKDAIKWLRIVEETSRVSESPGGTWMNQTFSISAALAWSPKIYHGIVPVEPDGSVFFEAPAGRAIYFQLLDKDYRLVRSMRTFVQAAPGTTRSCVGCHEYDNAPRNTSHIFRGRVPRKPVDESWGSGYIDFPSMIQPVLDRRCVSCHGGERGLAGGLDLTGGWTEYFSNSYEALTARREKQYIADLIAGICCMNGTADWSCQIFPHYAHGSGAAPLVKIMDAEPHRSAAKLTKAERELLLAWVDSNGLYYGTWDYAAAGPRLKDYPALRNQLIADMKANGCVSCHGDNKGRIQRFDNWINLERPELSLILRAPLAKGTDGFGLGLCRDRKVDQNFSRRGQMFKAGYAHQVLPLDKFPTQKWVPWKDAHQGSPVVSISGTDAPLYKSMLQKIRHARENALRKPRVDLPDAAVTGRGIVAGRSRQIIPQPLPEVMPPVKVENTPYGPRLSWERSARTIGLITEIHRGATPGFAPSPATLVGKTERFEFTDKGAAGSTLQQHYAIVFVSDPATTCGTCKSGATLDYNHTAQATAAPAVPERRRIEDRCPLSMVIPMRSDPAWASAPK